MLTHHLPIGFIPTNKPDAARTFYEHTLGLSLVSDDQFAIVFRLGSGMMLRVIRAGEFIAAPYTIFGWESFDIESDVQSLADKGVSFLRFPYFKQDELGIWTAPNGNKVAWFQDPDGNTLSISQHS